MQRSGHFEFGLDRRPINLGDSNRVKETQDYWSSGKEIQGWSIYWDTVYRYLANLFESQPDIRKSSIVVKFEELCRMPAEVLKRVLEHCELTDSKAVIEKFAPNIRRPDYYKCPFTTEEQAIIKIETAETARRWGMDNCE